MKFLIRITANPTRAMLYWMKIFHGLHSVNKFQLMICTMNETLPTNLESFLIFKKFKGALMDQCISLVHRTILFFAFLKKRFYWYWIWMQLWDLNLDPRSTVNLKPVLLLNKIRNEKYESYHKWINDQDFLSS